MVTTDKAELLLNFLATLPESLALRLASAVEVDRLAEGKQLPHELILEGLRPVLSRAFRVARAATPTRLFCRPFEDLLVSSSSKDKQKGRIARSSITPVWNWLAQSLLPDATAAYTLNAHGAIRACRPQGAEACAADYRAAAGPAMSDALADETGRKAARLALGGEAVLADADEMAILLSVAPQIFELQQLMPKPQFAMNDELLWAVRASYDSLAVTNPAAAQYVAVIAMYRLERPWEALRLPLMIARQTQDTLISNTDMGIVGELLLSELDSHAAAIRTVRQPQFDVDELIEHVSRFAQLSSGIVKEVEMRRDGRWGQRLMKDRAAVAELMDDMMKRAPREVLAALPTLKSGSYAGGPRVPDLSRPLDAEKRTRALGYAQLLFGCKPLAVAASFGASLAAADGEICIALKSYCEDIVRELRAAEGEGRARVEQYFALAVELTQLLFTAEEAEFLRRRGRAAVSAQAAA
jgi:hypothetical protein